MTIKVEVLDLAASSSQEGGGQLRCTWPAKVDLLASKGGPFWLRGTCWPAKVDLASEGGPGFW